APRTARPSGRSSWRRSRTSPTTGRRSEPRDRPEGSPLTKGHAMPKAIKVGVVTQAEGAHLPDYFSSLAKIEEAEAVALADPSGKTADLARKALGDKLKEVYKE